MYWTTPMVEEEQDEIFKKGIYYNPKKFPPIEEKSAYYNHDHHPKSNVQEKSVKLPSTRI